MRLLLLLLLLLPDHSSSSGTAITGTAHRVCSLHAPHGGHAGKNYSLCSASSNAQDGKPAFLASSLGMWASSLLRSMGSINRGNLFQ